MIYLTTTIITVGIIFIVLINRRNKTSIFFSSVLLSIIGWVLSLFYFYESNNYLIVLNLGRINFAVIVALGPLLYQFIKNFPTEKKVSNVDKLILLETALFISLAQFTTFIVADEKILGEDRVTVYGPGFYIFILHFLSYVLIGLVNLYRKYRTSQEKEKKQINILILKLSGALIFGFTTNLVIPVVFNRTSFISIELYTAIQNLGPFSGLIFAIPIGYSIIKYKFLDARVLLGKAFYYVLISIPPYFVYFILAYIYENIYGTSFAKAAYLMGIPVAVIFTSFINFFNKFISEYTDSHLINPGYNPLVVLEQLRQRLASALDIDRIGHEALFIIARTIRPNFTGIILKTDNHENEWISINYKSQSFTNPEIFSSFIHLLSNHKLDSLVYEELTSVDGYDIDLLLKQRVREQMEKLKLSVVIPIRQDFKVSGLLLLGQKEANSPYGRQEVRFLISIAESTSLAVGRALLYQEIQLFNATLQKKVNDATQALLNKNKDLEDALGKLEEIRRQEKDMLDVMGHELRTPISIARNAVVTLSKEVQKEETDEEKLSKYAKMAIESIRREISLIETFLSTTKLEGDRMQINLEPINLREIMEVSIEAHKDLAERNKTKVTINALEKDIVVNADKIRIQEIADNFLNNAIKYTGEGNVVISMYEKEELGWIDIKDDGIGISPENLQKLGKKFFRAQTLYNRSGNIVNPSGTGLGLFVSFQLIDLMHGRRVISSKEGEGSTFSFGLPLQPS